MINEEQLCKNYTNIINTLYTTYALRNLPGVKSTITGYLSYVIWRMNKNEVPGSYASTWLNMMEYRDGKDIMAVMNSIITVSKLLPEVYMHPISR